MLYDLALSPRHRLCDDDDDDDNACDETNPRNLCSMTVTTSMASSSSVIIKKGGRHRSIPLLDIAQYNTNRDDFVEGVRHACHTVGFFMVKHEFEPLARQMMDESRSFFDRSIEEKLLVSYEDSPSFRGYMRLGSENTAGQLDYREQVEYAVEYPDIHTKDCSARKTLWPIYERLKGTNPWPDDIQPTLRPTTLEYTTKVCEVADILRDSLCLALKVDPAVLRTKFAAGTDDDDNNNTDDGIIPHWVVKLVSYPPPPVPAASSLLSGDDDNPDNTPTRRLYQQGVGAHTDTNFLTLVLQDSVGGLQAYTEGEWIDVSSSDTTTTTTTGEEDENDETDDSCYDILICNLGEQAETWSRGYFLATPHRVIIRGPAVDDSNTKGRPRISVPLFYNPCLSATMGPLDEEQLQVQWERPHEYKQWRREDNTMIPSVGENTFKSLARSHPEVFARHHPDLQILPGGRIVSRNLVDNEGPRS